MSAPTPPMVLRNQLSLAADFSLRFVALFSRLFEGDVVMTLVYVAAVQASTQHLRHGGRGEALPGAFIADELRRPVSISALARSLAIPVETTRRYVIKLAARGLVQRTSTGGVLVTSALLTRPDIQAALVANSVNLDQLVAGLRRLAHMREA